MTKQHHYEDCESVVLTDKSGTYTITKIATIDPTHPRYKEWASFYGPDNYFAKAQSICNEEDNEIEAWVPLKAFNPRMPSAQNRQVLKTWVNKSKEILGEAFQKAV